jgi:hypothetical protein
VVSLNIFQPEQIHLALGGNWQKINLNNCSTVNKQAKFYDVLKSDMSNDKMPKCQNAKIQIVYLPQNADMANFPTFAYSVGT